MSTEAALEALQHIPGWDRKAEVTVRSVGNGKTNTSWVVQRNGKSFVLRVDSPVTGRLSLNRTNEIRVRTHVSRAGLAPAVIHWDSKRGILLSEYALGQTWKPEDVLCEPKLFKLAATLRTLYALPTVGAAFDPGSALRRYAEELNNDVSRHRAQAALSVLKTVSKRTPVLCHNDLVAENIVEAEQLLLIDWEYAGVGDPLFDLAVVIEHHGVEKPIALRFVESTLGIMNRKIASDLEAYCEVYQHLVVLWRDIV